MSKAERIPAYGYVRVSTEEQEEHATSIESQIAAVRGYAAKNGFKIIEMFSDAGLSGRKAKRPEFDRMIAQATAADRPVRAIIAYTQSRAYRNLETHVVAGKQLARAGVKIYSVTQTFAEGPSGDLMRGFFALMDENYSVEASCHTKRTMRANAEEGFFNGGPLPFGYESRTVEVRGKKEKRKLFVREDEAEIIRLVYELADRGHGDGPMGGRAIADYLNIRGYRHRGWEFHNSTIAKILTRPHYTGRYPNMTRGEDGKPAPEEEWIWVECPAIIDPERAARVAHSRSKRAPQNTPPRVTSGPTLLIQKVRCGMPECGTAMVLATGKSGKYRYYRCNRRTNAGAQSCRGPAIRVEVLDKMVVDALSSQLFTEDRLRALLQKVMDVSDESRALQRQQRSQCEAEIVKAETAISRLLDLVAQGLMSSRDPSLAEKLSGYRTAIATMQERHRLLDAQLKQSSVAITEESLVRFSDLITTKLRDADSAVRRNYVRMFVDEVIVGAEGEGTKVLIRGGVRTLEGAAFAAAGSKGAEVPIFDREWCRLRDSNT